MLDLSQPGKDETVPTKAKVDKGKGREVTPLVHFAPSPPSHSKNSSSSASLTVPGPAATSNATLRARRDAARTAELPSQESTTSSRPSLTSEVSTTSTPLPSSGPGGRPSPASSGGFANVASLLLRMRFFKNMAKASASSGQASKDQLHQFTITSGDAPISHDGLESIPETERRHLRHEELYICSGGVNFPMLLRRVRDTLLEVALSIGANALVDEHWSVTTLTSAHAFGQRNCTYRVQISYSASAIQTTGRDPHMPVALKKAVSIPGLMVILQHDDD